MKPVTSLDLLGLYHREYFLHGVAGHQRFRNGDGGMRSIVNMRRTYALALRRPLLRATDVGAGRGELAKHLVEQSVAVTVVDYSPAAIEIAREYVGEARFLHISATELAEHVAPASQDAIFLCDVAEHVSREELGQILAACAQVLAPHGVVCLHSPERTTGAVLTQRAVEARHINLMDIPDLAAALREHFSHAEAFTWDGVQAHRTPGRCLELFGVAGHRPPFAELTLRREDDGGFAFPGATAADGPWLLRIAVARGTASGAFTLYSHDGERLVETELRASGDDACCLLLASELLGDADWAHAARAELTFDGGAEATSAVLLTGAPHDG